MNKIKNIFYLKIFVYNKIKDYWENNYTLKNTKIMLK